MYLPPDNGTMMSKQKEEEESKRRGDVGKGRENKSGDGRTTDRKKVP